MACKQLLPKLSLGSNNGGVLQNGITWDRIITRLAQSGQDNEALDVFKRMQEKGYTLSRIAILAALKACSSMAKSERSTLAGSKAVKAASLETCKLIHGQASRFRLDKDSLVANRLADTYARCGSMVDAWKMFEKIKQRNVVSWTSVILGYVQNGEGKLALGLYCRMQQEGIRPDRKTVVAALKACGSVAEKERGRLFRGKLVKVESLSRCKQIHYQAVMVGVETQLFVASTLVSVYAKCGGVEDAWEVFQATKSRDAVAWSCMIFGYTQLGEGEMVAHAHSRMMLQEEAGGVLRTIEKCKRNSTGMNSGMLQARRVFDRMPCHDVAAWNCLIMGYAQIGEGGEALNLFSAMRENGIEANRQSFIAGLKACSVMAESEKGTFDGDKFVKASSLEAGRKIHRALGDTEGDIYVASTLVDMYAKCGSMEEARGAFERVDRPNVVTWTALILGYAANGEGEVALEMYQRMQQQDAGALVAAADARMFVAVLQACGSLSALETGRVIHADVSRTGLQREVPVANALIDFYGKCGSMEEAEQVFEAMTQRDVLSWSSLISGHSRQGNVTKVLELLEGMKRDGFKPDDVTFTSVLAACSHAGALATGLELFQIMATKYGVERSHEHYGCVVDLLGRVNRIDEALVMARETRGFRRDSVVWMSLLGACQKWGNVQVAREAFARVVEAEGKNPAAYVIMYNILMAAGLIEEAAAMSSTRKSLCGRKKPGESWWTDSRGRVHRFWAVHEVM